MNVCRFRLLVVAAAALMTSPAVPDVHRESDAVSQARSWRQSHEQAIVDEFVKLLSIPNVAADAANIRRNAELIITMLEPRGFEARLLELEGSPPAVFAERRVPNADTTLMIYVHYDGQPVNASDWTSNPWTPVMRDGPVESGGSVVPMVAPFNPEWRIFARSTSDDKAPIVALLAAIDALDAARIQPSVNIKLFFEGEEEDGSLHLRAMLKKYSSLLEADLWLFCDGPVHQSRRPQLGYGVRGVDGFNLTVFGAVRPLHSGHYGNWAPNPIIMLLELIGSMRDSQGNILIEDALREVVPPTDLELGAVDAAPRLEVQLIHELGIGMPETADRLEAAIMRPAMNILGIQSGQVGAAATNAIPVTATASIGLRLVPDQTPVYVRSAVENHIRDLGWHLIRAAPDLETRKRYQRIAMLEWRPHPGYPAYRTSMDNPIAAKLAGIVDAASDGELIHMPTFGGSLPLHIIHELTGKPVLILPIANHDNNQHGKDENIRLQNLWDAIEVYAAVLAEM